MFKFWKKSSTKQDEILSLTRELAEAKAGKAAAEAEVKVLREFNARIDDEAKRGLNMLTRGLAGYDFWNDPEKEAVRAKEVEKEAADAKPIVPVSGRDWARVNQEIEDAIQRKDTLKRRQEAIDQMKESQNVSQ